MSANRTSPPRRRATGSYSGYNAYMSRSFANTSEAFELAPDEVFSPKRPNPARKHTSKSVPARKTEHDRHRHDERIRQIRQRNKPVYEFVKEKSAVPALNIVTVFVIATCAFVWLATFSYGNILKRDLVKAQTEYTELVEKNDNERYLATKALNFEEIEKIGLTRLDMKKPTEAQKIYIDVPKNSYVVSFKAEEPQKEFKLSLGNLFNLFR